MKTERVKRKTMKRFKTEIRNGENGDTEKRNETQKNKEKVRKMKKFHVISWKKLVDRYTSHVTFSLAQRTCFMMCDTPHWLKCLHERVMSSPWSSMSCVWVFVLWFSVPRLFLFRVSLLPLALLFPLLPEPCPETLPPCGRRQGNVPLALRQMRSLAPWPNSPLSQVMSPSPLTTSTTQRPLKSSSRSNPATRCPRTCLTRNSTTRPSAERSLRHCSFTSEKNQRTEDKLITLFKKVCCQLSPFLCVMQERRDPCMNLVRQVHAAEKNQVAKWKTKPSGFSLKDKKSKFSLILEQRFTNTSSKPILIGEVSRNWVELSSLSEEKLITLLHVMTNFDEINYFFMNNCQNKIGIFVKLRWKVLMRWKNWSDFKGRHSMNFREEDWSKIKTLSLNSRPEFRNYRTKLIAWMIREILKMLNQYAVDYPTFPVYLRYSHLFPILVDCWAVLWECRAATISRQTFGTRMVYRETFL